MNFQKKPAIFTLMIGLLATCIVFVFRPVPRFDYDFENFFSQDNPELEFYQAYRQTFGNDNDYLLLALGNTPSIFDSLFLAKAAALQKELDSLDGVIQTVSLLTLEQPIVSPFGLRFKRVLDWSSSEALSRSQLEIKNTEGVTGSLINRSEDFLLIQIKNRQQITKEAGDILYSQIFEKIKSSNLTSFHLAGKIRAQGEFVNLMQREFAFFLAISFCLICLVLWLLFRTWWSVLISVIVLAVGIAWSLAVQLWMGKPLDLMSVMLPTILAIVGLAAIVHFFNKYLAHTRAGVKKDAAIEKTFAELWLPVFLTSLTTSLGFLTLYFTDVPVLKFFGLFTGIGVMLMFVAVMVLSPGMLYIFPGFGQAKRERGTKAWDMALRKVLAIIFQAQRRIALGFLTVTVVTLLFAYQLKINGYILDNLPDGSELLEEFRFFDREFGGSKPIEIHLDAGPKATSLFEKEVLEQIEKVEALSTAKLGAANLISPVFAAKFLNRAQNGGNDNAFKLPSRGQLLRMEPLIAKWSDISPVRVFSEDRREGRITGISPDFGSYQSGLDKEGFEKSLADQIDPGLLKVRLTGTSHLIDMSHQNVSIQLAKGIGFAFIVVAIVVGFLFRSWLLSILVLIPNVLPLFWVAGVMWLIGAELSLSTAIIFTVAFGIAVDDTIHFMAKLQSEYQGGKNWLYAIKRTYLETGKSIVLSSLVLISGFGILVFSQFGVTFYAGLLISLALLFALIADMVLLPVLMVFYYKVKKSKSISR